MVERRLNFTDQLPRIATLADVAAPWNGDPKHFRCCLCGHKFQVGDRWRWVFTNNVPGCEGCDGLRNFAPLAEHIQILNYGK